MNVINLLNDLYYMQIEESVFELIFPEGTLDFFDIISAHKDEKNVHITLEEKNNPPVVEGVDREKIKAKKFHDITITDFPLRGKRTLLTFRRRYWQIEGQKEYLKNDINLCFPGTQLEKGFADFLKDGGGERSGIPNFYRKVSSPPSERI